MSDDASKTLEIKGKEELVSLIFDSFQQQASDIIKLPEHEWRKRFVGNVFSMDFNEALVLTNDSWKKDVGGIPHNCFLVGIDLISDKLDATSEQAKSHPSLRGPTVKEVVLFRVIGPAPLPSDSELTRLKVEHEQRRLSNELFIDSFDILTQNELQYSALRCKILGTFYMEESASKMVFGSDVENYFCSRGFRVFKPGPHALEKMINFQGHQKALLPSITAGHVRYTSTQIQEGKPSQVEVNLSDFLAKRTALFGMTRTGKSNTVKTLVSALHLASLEKNHKIGQMIFDINGEYANANHQDDQSCIYEALGAEDCYRYCAISREGFDDLRYDFFKECSQAHGLMKLLMKENKEDSTQLDMQIFLETKLDNVVLGSLKNTKQGIFSTHDFSFVESYLLIAIFHAMLHLCNFTHTISEIEFVLPEDLFKKAQSHEELKKYFTENSIQTSSERIQGHPFVWIKMPVSSSFRFFIYFRQHFFKDKERLSSGLTRRDHLSMSVTAFLNLLVSVNSEDRYIRGCRVLSNYTAFHCPIPRKMYLFDEIKHHLINGKVIIWDLSLGPVEVRSAMTKMLVTHLFNENFKVMVTGQTPPDIVLYVEEAHNLIGKTEDLKTIWPRIAKEGAKANIAFMYSTQEPSSVHPNVMANTENWFVTHLNNKHEIEEISKYSDFMDFKDSIRKNQDVGFSRVKTLSSPFIIPTQIQKFNPSDIKRKIKEINSKNRPLNQLGSEIK